MFGNKEAKKAEEIRTQIVERLEKQGSVLANFSVKFEDGIVTLAGDCDTAKTRDKAVLMAKGIEGVKDVRDSDLRVPQAAASAPAPSAPSPAAPTPAPAPAPASHPLGAAAGSVGQAATRAAAPQPTTQTAPQAAPTAAAPAAQPPAQPQPAALAETIYTVQAGDNLSKIAKQFYGNANKYMVIFEANRDILKDPDKIAIGQKLRIPAKS